MTSTDTRRCIGSERYGIAAHEASLGDFPKQPSQKDGLGRMCKPHWNQYTASLARDRKARQGDDGAAVKTPAKPAKRQAEAPAKAERVTGETPAVTARRQAFEKRLAKVGPSSEEGQRMMEQRGRARNDKAIAAKLEASLRDDPPGAISTVGQGGEESPAA